MPPFTLPLISEGIPGKLKSEDRWVCWRWERRGSKWTKVPINAASGGRADSTKPSTWAPYTKAVRCAEARGLPGVGFVFTGSPFAGADLDGCCDPETGRLEEWAREIVAELDSYAEVSPSGTGVKVFVRGTLPAGRKRKGRIEMYDSSRFFTVTGHRLPEAPTSVMGRTEQLAALHRRVFGPAPGDSPAKPRHARPADLPGGADLDDAELVRRATAAANGKKFATLWSGDRSGYGSGSEADLALCSMLAFWCGPDESRIARLFGESALCREKWTGREDYRKRTIAAALECRSEYWSKPGSGKVYARRKAVISVG